MKYEMEGVMNISGLCLYYHLFFLHKHILVDFVGLTSTAERRTLENVAVFVVLLGSRVNRKMPVKGVLTNPSAIIPIMQLNQS